MRLLQALLEPFLLECSGMLQPFNLYGNHFSRYCQYHNGLEKVKSVQLFSILAASLAKKFYMETGCLQQLPANHCLPLLTLKYWHSYQHFTLSYHHSYKYLTFLQPKSLQHHIQTFPLNLFDSCSQGMADGRWKMAENCH